MNHDKITDQQFRLKNVFISDLTDYNEIYFYVYNDSDMTVTWSLNYGLFATLLPRRWTECSFKGFEGLGKASTNPIMRENFSVTDINGLTMASFLDDWTGMAQATFYVSSVYARKPVTADEVAAALSALPETLTEADKGAFLNAVGLYKKLTEEEQTPLKTVYRKVCAAYEEYLERSFPVEKRENVAVYLGTDFGLEQISVSYADACNVTDVSYGQESGSLLLEAAEYWLAEVEFSYPALRDASTAKELFLYVYYDAEDGHSYNARLSPTETGVRLESGKWTKVSFSDWNRMHYGADRKDISGTRLSVYCDDWENMIPAGTRFYVSPLYLG